MEDDFSIKSLAKAAQMKPLFIALKTEHFNAFKKGEKTNERRLYGKRWNERTCVIGRPVILSKGYGNYDRIPAVITAFNATDVQAFDENTQAILFNLYGSKLYTNKIANIKIIPDEPIPHPKPEKPNE